MPNDEKTPAEQSSESSAQQQTSPNESSLVKTEEGSIGENPKRQEGRKEAPGAKESINWDRRISFSVAAFALIEIVVGGLQCWVMARQTTLMENQLMAMNTQSSEMIAQSASAKGQLDAMREQNNEMVKQSDAMKKQLDLIQADQRPWLIISEPTMEWYKPDGGARRPIITYKVTNTGRTYAQITKHGISITITVRDPSVGDMASYEPIGKKTIDVIAPGFPVTNSTAINVTDDKFRDAVFDRKLALYLRGMIIYTDGAGGVHHTSCDYWYDYSNNTFHDQGGQTH